MNRLAIAVLGAVLVVLSLRSPARADEWDDFEQARAAYLAQDYPLAVERLEGLVGGEVPSLQNETLLLESRKYLGAAYLFLGRRDDAAEQFTRLLRADATYQIDPTQFPQEVVQLFDEVRARVEDELAEEQRRSQEAALAQREQELRLLLENEARIRELEALARQETVRTVNSRWLAMLPFGIGQFRNGNRRLGLALAATQSIFFGVSVGTFIGYQVLPAYDPRNPPGIDVGALRTVSNFLEITNWISTSAFAGLALFGIVEAQIRYQPYVVTTRVRPLPGGASGGTESSRVELRFGAGLGGGSLGIAF